MILAETLERALHRSLKEGYTPLADHEVVEYKSHINKAGIGYLSFMLSKREANGSKLVQLTVSVADLIFDHEFLKAYYGAEFKEHAKQLALLSSGKGRINYLGSTS